MSAGARLTSVSSKCTWIWNGFCDVFTTALAVAAPVGLRKAPQKTCWFSLAPAMAPPRDLRDDVDVILGTYLTLTLGDGDVVSLTDIIVHSTLGVG